MLRHVFTAVAVFSALLCGVVLAEWARSYWTADQVWVRGKRTAWNLEVPKGHALLSVTTENVPHAKADWQVSRIDALPLGDFLPSPDSTNILGVRFGRFTSPGWSTFHPGPSGFFVAVPLPWIGAMLALLPVLWVVTLKNHRQSVRRRAGLCVRCAYDLRGMKSSECPECGQRIAK